MLKLVAQPIRNLADLRAALQNAVRLEHSTIPPYLRRWQSGKSPRSPMRGRSSATSWSRKCCT